MSWRDNTSPPQLIFTRKSIQKNPPSKSFYFGRNLDFSKTTKGFFISFFLITRIHVWCNQIKSKFQTIISSTPLFGTWSAKYMNNSFILGYKLPNKELCIPVSPYCQTLIHHLLIPSIDSFFLLLAWYKSGYSKFKLMFPLQIAVQKGIKLLWPWLKWIFPTKSKTSLPPLKSSLDRSFYQIDFNLILLLLSPARACWVRFAYVALSIST